MKESSALCTKPFVRRQCESAWSRRNSAQTLLPKKFVSVGQRIKCSADNPVFTILISGRYVTLRDQTGSWRTRRNNSGLIWDIDQLVPFDHFNVAGKDRIGIKGSAVMRKPNPLPCVPFCLFFRTGIDEASARYAYNLT